MKRIEFMARLWQRRLACALPVREDVALESVLGQVYAAIERFWDLYEGHESLYGIELVGDMSSLLLTPRSHSSRRQPPRIAMRSFMTELISIFEQATGQQIGRWNLEERADKSKPLKQQSKASKHSWRRHPFLAVCIAAASFGQIKKPLTRREKKAGLRLGRDELHGMKYPSGIIQEVLETLHSGTQRLHRNKTHS